MLTNYLNNAKKLKELQSKAKISGLVFGIITSLGIVIMAFPFGMALGEYDYMVIATCCLYPIGLFVGLKWKRLGILICLSGFLIYMIAVFMDPHFDPRSLIIHFVFFLILMIPVVLYMIIWIHFKNTKGD